MDKLVLAAQQAKAQALARYSNFKVGAAIETAAGKIYTGCNIESSSYGLTCCAERVAIFKALSEGERDFVRIVIAADTEEFCTPCGACRQVLWDYAQNVEVVCVNKSGAKHQVHLRDLLPEAFDDRLLNKP
ncbi:MAG: cytidine deaminase [candidate division KSB1 bacterium]|nr:cytidine deaminase [candidate division KSB1 bacterium]MDZ7305258.1 cytidine deaminase [candidate division KSB1 bacterium]MDZ7312042.1 cytidine deaminase [candidate division KSB1 bacterium]